MRDRCPRMCQAAKAAFVNEGAALAASLRPGSLQLLGDVLQVGRGGDEIGVGLFQIAAQRRQSLICARIVRGDQRWDEALRARQLRAGVADLRHQIVILLLLLGDVDALVSRRLDGLVDGRLACDELVMQIAQVIEPDLVIIAWQHDGEDAELRVNVVDVGAGIGDVCLAVQLFLECLQAGDVGPGVGLDGISLRFCQVLIGTHTGDQRVERADTLVDARVAERDDALQIAAAYRRFAGGARRSGGENEGEESGRRDGCAPQAETDLLHGCCSPSVDCDALVLALF